MESNTTLKSNYTTHTKKTPHIFKPLMVCLCQMDSISVCSIRNKLCWDHAVGRPPLTCHDVRISDKGRGRGGSVTGQFCSYGSSQESSSSHIWWPGMWQPSLPSASERFLFITEHPSCQRGTQSDQDNLAQFSGPWKQTLMSRTSLKGFLGAVQPKVGVLGHAIRLTTILLILASPCAQSESLNFVPN